MCAWALTLTYTHTHHTQSNTTRSRFIFQYVNGNNNNNKGRPTVRVTLRGHNWWTLQNEYMSSSNASIVKQFRHMPERLQMPVRLSIWYWGFIIWFHAKKNYRLNLPDSFAYKEHCLHDKCDKLMKLPICCQATLSQWQQTQNIFKWFCKGQHREPRQRCVLTLTEGLAERTFTLYLIRTNQPWASFSLHLIYHRLLFFEVLGNISFWFIILGFRATGWKKKPLNGI